MTRKEALNTPSPISSSSLEPSSRGRPILRLAAIGALAAGTANAVLWTIGRAADVDFLVTPIGSDSVTEIGVVEAVVATVVLFAIGSVLLALAARRSRRWVDIVTVAAAAFAVASVGGPLSTAEDASTGALLTAMHLLTGAVFVAVAMRVRADDNG
jgi:hypothetical protein